jgi:hypothetical protein
VIADLAREFRDEATLTESVSRAYNLMVKAGIKDIGVFTAKIYEARAITKERYGSIKRGRMPYFFRSWKMSAGNDESLPSNPVLPLRSLERRAWGNVIVFAASHQLLSLDRVQKLFEHNLSSDSGRKVDSKRGQN